LEREKLQCVLTNCIEENKNGRKLWIRKKLVFFLKNLLVLSHAFKSARWCWSFETVIVNTPWANLNSYINSLKKKKGKKTQEDGNEESKSEMRGELASFKGQHNWSDKRRRNKRKFPKTLTNIRAFWNCGFSSHKFSSHLFVPPSKGL